MPVLSKFIDKTADKYNIRKENISRSLVAGTIFLYGLKLGYPYIQSFYKNRRVQQANRVYGEQPFKQCDVNCKNGKEVIQTESFVVEKKEKKQNIKPVSRHPTFNIQFLLQLHRLVRLMVPGIWTPESGLLLVHSLALATRTFLSIYVAAMEGQIVKYIVRRDVSSFGLMLCKWLGVAIPATFINSMIRYLENRLALAFRYDVLYVLYICMLV